MGSFRIEGIVKDQDTLVGIADLVVVALDVDAAFPGVRGQSSWSPPSHLQGALTNDRLGSVLTDAKGRFSLEFDASDFASGSGETRPDILLAVVAPEVASGAAGEADAPVLHVSPVLRLKAGRREAYSIRLSSALVAQHRLIGARSTGPTDPKVMQADLQRTIATSRQLTAAKLEAFQARREAGTELHRAADELFAQFSLSGVSEAIRDRDTYLRASDDLAVLQGRVIDQGLARLAAREDRRTLHVDVGRDLVEHLDLLDPSGAVRTELSLPRLWQWWTTAVDTALERRRSAYETCAPLFREDQEDESDGEDGADPVAGGGGSDGDGAPPTAPPPADGTILDRVLAQLECATCPEEPLRYAQHLDPQHAGRDLSATIQGLELVAGPTDVTSYHDFQSVQVAFESIWTEAFDERLGELGRDIFTEVVRLQDDRWADALIGASRTTLNDPSSLKALLSEYRRISGNPVNTRLDRLFTELEQRLTEPYKFDVFAPNSINYGVVYTFRQTWKPGPYQVGRLVNTVPLAPKEERKYETKTVRKQSRGQKIIEERAFKGASESTTTSRAESEIVARATNKTSFTTTTNGQLNVEMVNMQFGTTSGMDAEKFSSSTKKNFRESVLKSAEEYRKETKLEVTISSEETFEASHSGTLVNPNDEIAVTYLFYELQRQYRISEQLHRITPVVLVAFEVPRPHEVDDDWLMAYAWIVRRALLDESFRPALDWLTQSTAGDEIALQELGVALQKQQKLVDELNRQLELRNQTTDTIMSQILGVMTGDAVVSTIKEVGDFVHGLLNPFAGLMGGDSGPDLEKFKEVLELQLERSEKEQQRLEARLRDAMSDLQSATARFGEAVQQHYNRQTAIAQLRLHVKENVLYYMQAIWDYEPPDQRFFRLYDLEVDWFEAPEAAAPVRRTVPVRDPATGEITWVETDVTLPIGGVLRSKRKLVDVADLDTLLGFKGNYAIFPMKESNWLHLHMMQDFVDTQTGGLRDPDRFADATTQELIDYLACIREHHPDVYAEERDDVVARIHERQQSPRREEEVVIVPTDALYLECLPGKHPILESFKLVHRAIDVKKVQAEVRKLELENLRLGARLLAGERGDPDVDKLIRVQGDGGVDVET